MIAVRVVLMYSGIGSLGCENQKKMTDTTSAIAMAAGTPSRTNSLTFSLCARVTADG